MARLWKGLRFSRIQKYPLSDAGLIYFVTRKGSEVSFYIDRFSSAKELFFAGFDTPPINVGEKVDVWYETRTQAELGLPNRKASIWVFGGIDGLE